MMMYYWIYKVKCKHVMLFEDTVSWDTVVNYNNYFGLECRNWLWNQQVQLGGFDANGQPMYVEVDESRTSFIISTTEDVADAVHGLLG